MNYLKEIKTLIEKDYINDQVIDITKNNYKLNTYYEIGKIIVEMQGGKERAKYGDRLLKEFSIELVSTYGKGYNYSNLKRFRQFYLTFEKGATLWHQLNWSILKIILPIKNINKRNYYINQVILKNLSVRELKNEIKTNSFERLSYTDKENIKLIESNNYNLTIKC